MSLADQSNPSLSSDERHNVEVQDEIDGLMKNVTEQDSEAQYV
jgi:hypothetical protein